MCYFVYIKQFSKICIIFCKYSVQIKHRCFNSDKFTCWLSFSHSFPTLTNFKFSSIVELQSDSSNTSFFLFPFLAHLKLDFQPTSFDEFPLNILGNTFYLPSPIFITVNAPLIRFQFPSDFDPQ